MAVVIKQDHFGQVVDFVNEQRDPGIWVKFEDEKLEVSIEGHRPISSFSLFKVAPEIQNEKRGLFGRKV
ncbi:MAG: hypothetical protein K2P86_15295 [Xanthobacteraceae bacterium]|nr:hypothetical protein [Xanthobacteraceae bacterium]